MEYHKKIIKANHSPNSIKDVFAIVVVEENKGMGYIKCQTYPLNGSIKQKLLQYKELTGKDWVGFHEEVVSTPILTQSPSLNLGKMPTKSLSPASRHAQEQIDKLSELARRWLDENDVAKKLPREEQLAYLGEDSKVVVE